jgi:hypothetical protein
MTWPLKDRLAAAGCLTLFLATLAAEVIGIIVALQWLLT